MKQVYIEQGFEKAEYTILKTYRPFNDKSNDYLVIKVKNTTFSCKKQNWEEYVMGCTEEHWRMVDNWVSDNLMPYVNRKAVNYNSPSSYGLKEKCEKEIGSYVAEELLIALIISKGVCGENKYGSLSYPTTLYFPLSNQFNQIKVV